MNKKEMREILIDALNEKEKNIKEYRNIMKKILPECIENNNEVFENNNEYIDFNNPDKSVMTIVFDFICNDKPNLTKKEKTFLKNFDKNLSLISICQYALKEDKRFFDSKTLHVKKEDIIITDPCYLGHNRGYELNHIHHNTIYGDWSCIVINEDNDEIIGTFCSDAGEVGIFKLNEVKEAYPQYNYMESYPHTVTVIRNFTGDVTIKVGFDKKHKRFYCYVEGKGSINFKSYQNGF